MRLYICSFLYSHVIYFTHRYNFILMNVTIQDTFFEDLSKREITVLTSNSTTLTFDREEMLFKNESLLFSVYYIKKGEVKLRDKNKKLFHILGKGEFIGLSYLYNTVPIFFSAYAIENTEIIQFEINAFRVFVANNTKFLQKVFNKSGDNFRILTKCLLSFRRNKINGAFASFLLHYSQKDCLNNLTRKDIGEILSYSRENISKVIKVFVEDGYIEESDKHLKILDEEGLKKLKKIG